MTIVTPNAPAGRSAHVDTFCRDRLPPPELWPWMDYSTLPELAYPSQLNCATELLDRMVDSGHADRTAFLFPGGRWTYRDVLEMSNRIAHVLAQDLGVVPGNRILLRGPNSPMTVACLNCFSRSVVRMRSTCRPPASISDWRSSR